MLELYANKIWMFAYFVLYLQTTITIKLLVMDVKATVEDLRKELWLRKRKKLVWETKDGQLIPLEQMTDKHLENAINYFDKMEEMREIVLENDNAL